MFTSELTQVTEGVNIIHLPVSLVIWKEEAVKHQTVLDKLTTIKDDTRNLLSTANLQSIPGHDIIHTPLSSLLAVSARVAGL